ncbi:MAG: SCO family protein [Betaproteobacteria bacterium]|jgi:protein SCO1/2
MFKKSITIFQFVISCSVLGILLNGCELKPKFNNVDITGSNSFSPVFELEDPSHKLRHLDDFKGKVVIVFFGYTQCPDVCPTTLTEMQGVMKLLGEQASKVQVLFITLDPERDTAELLENYVPAFDKSFLGLRPQDEKALNDVTTGYKIFFQKVPGKSPGSYSLDHTAGSYVVDKEGHLRLFVRHNLGEQTLADDLRVLIKQ